MKKRRKGKSDVLSIQFHASLIFLLKYFSDTKSKSLVYNFKQLANKIFRGTLSNHHFIRNESKRL